MRVAVVSDIHGNRRAFQAVLADLKQVAPDLIVHGGDLVFGGAHPADIIDAIRALGWPGVMGNTDAALWTQKRMIEMASAQPKLASLLGRLREMIAPIHARIGDERLRWLKTLPPVHRGDGLAVVHASPKDLWRAPMANAADDEVQKTYAELSAAVVIYGHIHVSYVRRLSGMTVANAGSVSQSYDGDRRAAYAVIDRGNVTIRPRGVRRGERGEGPARFRSTARGVAEPDFAGRKILSARVSSSLSQNWSRLDNLCKRI